MHGVGRRTSVAADQHRLAGLQRACDGLNSSRQQLLTPTLERRLQNFDGLEKIAMEAHDCGDLAAFRRLFGGRGFAVAFLAAGVLGFFGETSVAISNPKISRASLASTFDRAGAALANGSALPALAMSSASFTACNRKSSSGCSSNRAPMP